MKLSNIGSFIYYLSLLLVISPCFALTPCRSCLKFSFCVTLVTAPLFSRENGRKMCDSLHSVVLSRPVLSRVCSHSCVLFSSGSDWMFCNVGKEGNVLFNDVLNTFYLRLYGVGHMVKYHSASERENPLIKHGVLFPISSKVFFICTIP